MSDRNRRDDDRQESSNEAFETLNRELHLELEDPSTPETRAVGIAIIPASAPTVVRETPSAPAGVEDAEGALRELVTAWETAPEADEVQICSGLATTPFLVASPGRIQVVDRERLAEGHVSQERRIFGERYPYADPRQVEIENFQVVYLGGARAQVTYRVHETYANGEVWAGNCASLAVQAANGDWKIAFWTKRDM